METPVQEAVVNAQAVNDMAPESEILEELLVEEISIDGMCGVY